jgi:hypothetical protein
MICTVFIPTYASNVSTIRVYVAQSVERPTFNRVVAGSIPAMGVIFASFCIILHHFASSKVMHLSFIFYLYDRFNA